MTTKIETANKIVEIFQLIGSLDKKYLEDTVDYCEDKESTYGLFHTDDLDVLRKRRKRVEGLLEFRKILEDTEE